MESRPAEWRSCLTESAHLVLGRPLGLFQPWMVGLKSKTLLLQILHDLHTIVLPGDYYSVVVVEIGF